MRWGIEEYRTGRRAGDPDAQERLAVLLDRYDLTLVRLAVMLGVEVSIAPQVPGAGLRLNDEVRALLEHAVRVFGLDIGRGSPPS